MMKLSSDATLGSSSILKRKITVLVSSRRSFSFARCVLRWAWNSLETREKHFHPLRRVTDVKLHEPENQMALSFEIVLRF